MGYQDRDYIREDGEGTSLWSNLSVTAKLIILNVILYLANLFFSESDNAITRALWLSPESVPQPLYWYQFLTAGFAHDPESVRHIFGNMLGLYFFGRPLEDRYGGREFLRFYLAAILIGNITWGLRQYFFVDPPTMEMGGRLVANWPHLLGASGAVIACIILFIVQNPRATLLANLMVPVPAWLIGVLYIAMDLVGVATQRGDETLVAYDVHLTGAAFAVAYWYFGWNFRWVPGLDGFGGMRSAKRWFKPRPALKVHAPEAEYEDLDAEADRLLEKVHEQGESSLTAREKKILEAYSRRLRQKLR